MEIRPATLADVPRLVAMGRAQLAALYAGRVPDDPAHVEAVVRALLDGPAVATFVADVDGAAVGMIGLALFRHPVTGQRTVGEVMWWMEPTARGAGVRLLRRAEQWAAEVGAEVIQVGAPTERVARLYAHRGYTRAEVTYTRPVGPTASAITVVDDVLPDVDAYRRATLALPVGDVEPFPGVVFHGIRPAVDGQLPLWIETQYPGLTPTLTFVRQSPAGQVEPNYIHTDCDMGQWTAILYLTAEPPPADGTTFWRARATGAVQSVAATPEAQLDEWQRWRDPALWEPWHTVAARPNRLVLFPAPYFHSRAIPDHYGTGDDARVIQVVFGTGVWPPSGGAA